MTVDQLIKRLSEIDCLTPSKKVTAAATIPAIFYVRGTRLSVKILTVTKYDKNTGKYVNIPKLAWAIKEKNRSKFRAVTFEDVLDLDFIGSKAKTELLFHLDLFAGNNYAS